ncbi:hypothetical protein J2T15_004597 [Paenibacillus harenae]|uniref:Uncharacterized protein n=1 Tax=Paenibacillus harenae TaxID=306543 RepID=A0ABT9U9M6_PAEHA|nr:hypothetical protein [Paenibacillus harenae]
MRYAEGSWRFCHLLTTKSGWTFNLCCIRKMAIPYVADFMNRLRRSAAKKNDAAG